MGIGEDMARGSIERYSRLITETEERIKYLTEKRDKHSKAAEDLIKEANSDWCLRNPDELRRNAEREKWKAEDYNKDIRKLNEHLKDYRKELANNEKNLKYYEENEAEKAEKRERWNAQNDRDYRNNRGYRIEVDEDDTKLRDLITPIKGEELLKAGVIVFVFEMACFIIHYIHDSLYLINLGVMLHFASAFVVPVLFMIVVSKVLSRDEVRAKWARYLFEFCVGVGIVFSYGGIAERSIFANILIFAALTVACERLWHMR